MTGDPHHDDEHTLPPLGTSTVGAGWVPLWAILVMLTFVLLIGGLLLYCIWAFWPTEQASSQAANALNESRRIAIFGGHVSTSLDVVLFVIVAAAGALGALIHTIRSLTWYLGNRSLRWSWVPFYVMLPLVGAGGGTVFYLVFRAGLFSPSTTTTQVNPFGFAAIASLVGLFSEQAMEKLHEVFGSLLAPARTGKDHAAPPDEAAD
jgi:hypothetical protein